MKATRTIILFRALADTDADGKMDLTEFSIACKLISCKLRNFEIPKMLPPTLIASLKHIGTPIRTPTGAMSPTESYKQFITQPAQQPNIPVAAVPQQQYQQPMMMQQQMMPQQVPMMMAQPQIPDMQQQIAMMQQQMQSLIQQQAPQMVPMPVAPVPVAAPPVPIAPVTAPVVPMPVAPMSVPTGTILPSQPPLMTNNIPAHVAPPPLVDQLSSGSLLDSLAQTQPTIAATGPLPAAPTPTPPQSGHASRSMSFSEKAPSVPESP